MMVIADAAPGDEPQMAVVPGNKPVRLSNQPKKLDATIVETVPIKNKGHSRAIFANTVNGKLFAIIMPKTPCAIKNMGFGSFMPAPLVAKIMAVIIGPSNNAAGSRKSSNITTNTNEARSNTVSRHGAVQREGVVISDKIGEGILVIKRAWFLMAQSIP